MFFADMPPLPPEQYAQVVAAPARVLPPTGIVGACILATNPPDPSTAANPLGVKSGADEYFYRAQKMPRSAVKFTLLQAPNHGRIEQDEQGEFWYIPTTGYLGNDGAVFQANADGEAVRIEYFIRVAERNPEVELGTKHLTTYCAGGDRVWTKISTTPHGPTNGPNSATKSTAARKH